MTAAFKTYVDSDENTSLDSLSASEKTACKIIGSGLAMWTYDETESEFGSWHKNSFVQLGAEVSF